MDNDKRDYSVVKSTISSSSFLFSILLASSQRRETTDLSSLFVSLWPDQCLFPRSSFSFGEIHHRSRRYFHRNLSRTSSFFFIINSQNSFPRQNSFSLISLFSFFFFFFFDVSHWCLLWRSVSIIFVLVLIFVFVFVFVYCLLSISLTFFNWNYIESNINTRQK